MPTVTVFGTRDWNIPVLESLSSRQIDAIQRIQPHASADAPAIDARRPASIFLDQSQFDLEWEKLFRALPVPVTLSALIPEPGNLIAIESYGVPIIVTRARDGEVRAFLNASIHKGSKLVEQCEPHSAARLT